MTMTEIKRFIVSEFKKAFGFAPLMKEIIVMEATYDYHTIRNVTFTVHGKAWEASYYHGIERCESLDDIL